MGHEAHVRLVDAHAESDGGDDDEGLSSGEPLLGLVRVCAGKPGMVGQRPRSPPVEPGGDLVDPFAAAAVDDAGLVGMVVADETAKAGACRCPSGAPGSGYWAGRSWR